MVTVELPWPSRDLHPNSRVHWGAVRRAARKARADAKVAGMAAGARKLRGGALDATFTFCPPDNRRRDIDGMLSAMKPSIDGLADLCGIDDSKWSMALERGDTVPNGKVIVSLVARSSEGRAG